MSNNITVCGATYEQAMESAKAISLRETHQGCRVFVNAVVVRLSKDAQGQRFNVMFKVSEWYDCDTTVGAYQDGQEYDV